MMGSEIIEKVNITHRKALHGPVMIIYYGLGCNKLYLHLRNNKSKRVRERVPVLTSCQKSRKHGGMGLGKEPETISHVPENVCIFLNVSQAF